MSELNDLLAAAIARAEARGATGVDGLAVDYLEGHVRVRLGEVDQIQRARQRRLGLRVFFGQRQAITSSGDLRPETLDRLVDDACDMARVTAEDPHAGLPDPGSTGAAHTERPDLFEPGADEFDLADGADWARRAEAAAMGADERIQNSEGAEFGFGSALRVYAASGGVQGSYRTSWYTGYVVPVATDEKGMERDYWYSQRHHLAELEAPEVIGQIAAARTLRRLGARQVPTTKVPVIFDERTASQLLGHVSGALSGYSVYRGASYLIDKIGERVASDRVTVVDDPLLRKGMGTKPYDGEGIATRKKTVIGAGVLETYLLDTYSAKKLGLQTTGNAARSVGDAPSARATNLHLQPGDCSEEALLEGVADGFYVTELIGFGVNVTTGDYSQGAAGMWIQDGKLAFPVSEVTIAGNLLTMMQGVDAVADNLDPFRAVSSPSLRIREMTVAGA